MKRFFKISGLSIGLLLVFFAGYFFQVRKLDNDAVEAKDFYSSSYDVRKPVLLASSFINGERFYIKIPTVKGDTVLGFGDSGGGITMTFPPVIDKLGLQSKVKWALLKGLMPMRYILFDDLVKDENIPPPLLLRNMILRTPLSRVPLPFLYILPTDGEVKFLIQIMSCDLFLGQNFFMGKSWTFDYIHRQIWVNTPIPASEEGKPGVQRIGFKKNSNHENVFGHASMFIEVNGEIIEVLFDTGATIVLSENGKKMFNTSAKTIGGSFIAASVFDKWRKEHPDWKYYEKADMDRDIIEVPSVKIGGYEVGPVLFAKRNDENWSKGMIGSMDKVVKGAIGGSAFKYLKATVDYNSELIRFEK
jgi:hypothetical protein